MVVISDRIRAARANAAERRIKAWQLRKAGASLHVIGDRLGISYEQARRDCNVVIEQLSKEAKGDALAWRTTQLQRCEDLILGLWSKASKGDPQAVTAVLGVFNRQAALLGLDAPKKQEITGADGGAIQLEVDANVSVEERQRRILAIVEQARGRSHTPALTAGPDLATSAGGTDDGMADAG